MARRYKDRQMQKVYDLYDKTPPARRGCGLSDAYFNGFNHPDRKDRYVRGSLAYAAWAVGVDHARVAAKASAK